MHKRMSFRFYFVIVLLIFGVAEEFVGVESLQPLGFIARYTGVLALAVYSVFFAISIPEDKESLKALAQSLYTGLFAFAFAGFVIMVVGQEKILQVKISTIVAFFSLVFVLTMLVAYRQLSRKRKKKKHR